MIPSESKDPSRFEAVRLPLVPAGLEGELGLPAEPRGLVIFAHGSGSSRLSPRNRYVADVLNEAGLATLLFDLLTEREASQRANVFDIERLAERLAGAVRWVRERPDLRSLPIGLFGASTGAAAALVAAAELPDVVDVVVSRGGRPDLAGPSLERVRAPTLLLVGGHDEPVIGLNKMALAHLGAESRLEIVPGATHLFEEPGTLERVAEHARDWLVRHLAPARAGR